MADKKYKIELVSDTEARCRICRDIKPLSNFRANTGQWNCKKFRLSYCNSCKNEKRRERARTNILSLVRIKIQAAKHRAKIKGMAYNLDAEYVLDEVKKQIWDLIRP